MSIRKMDKLQVKLKKIQKEIKELQNACSHEETRVGFNQTSPNFVRVMVICKNCDKCVRYPSKEESDRFLKS